MRLKLFLRVLCTLSTAAAAHAQTGQCASATFRMPDANVALAQPQQYCRSLYVTGALTMTRTIFASTTPGQQYTVTNATTGGQSIVIGGVIGSTVAVANGATVSVVNTDGNNYVQSGGTGGGGGASPATSNSLGTVQLASGQSSTTLAALATSGSASDITSGSIAYARAQAAINTGLAAAGVNPDTTKNGSVNLTYTGTGSLAPPANTVQQTQAQAVPTSYAWSMPGTPPPDSTHTSLAFTLSNGVWQAGWVSSSGTAPPSSATQIDYWPLSDTTGTDSVGSNTLTLTSATATTDATLGNVLTFAGGGNSGGLSTSTTLTNFTNTTAFSLAGWIKPTATGNNVQEIFASLTNSGTYQGYTLNTTNGNLQLQLISNLGSTNYMICSTANSIIAAGSLHHAAVTYDGSQASGGVRIYLDGSSVSFTCSGTLSATIANGSKLGIGRTIDGVNTFSGELGKMHVDSGVDAASVISGYYTNKN